MAKRKEEFKMIKWFNAGCPPVDLHANVLEIIKLIREVKRLRKLVKK
jgi:hypothetical protein